MEPITKDIFHLEGTFTIGVTTQCEYIDVAKLREELQYDNSLTTFRHEELFYRLTETLQKALQTLLKKQGFLPLNSNSCTHSISEHLQMKNMKLEIDIQTQLELKPCMQHPMMPENSPEPTHETPHELPPDYLTTGDAMST